MVCVSWDTIGVEVVESLSHLLLTSPALVTPTAVSGPWVPPALYIAGDDGKVALDAAAVAGEWLHPSKLDGLFESRSPLLLTAHVDNRR